MKKLSFLLFTLLAVTMFTSCLKDEPNKDIFTAEVTINSRTSGDADNIVFSNNLSVIEIDNANMTIKFTTGYKDVNGAGHNLTTPAMPLTPVGGPIYSFSDSGSSLNGISNLNGYIDMLTTTAWYSFTLNGTEKVISTTDLIFSYATMTVTNPDNGNNNSYYNFQCAFFLDETGKKCSMVITNFTPNLNGQIVANQIEWNNLTVTPTATGYHITTEMAESAINKGFNTIKNLNFNITLTDESRRIDGSFMCNDLNIKIEGDLFPKAQL